MVPWEKRYLEGSEEGSKEKAHITRKISEGARRKYISPEKYLKIETKDNPDKL